MTELPADQGSLGNAPPTLPQQPRKDWLQSDSLNGLAEASGPPTVDAPPWVPSDQPPTLETAPRPDQPMPRPEIPGYEIVAELGRGGMGVVYKARQVGLNRWVALKMILGGAHAGSKDLARFQAEAQAVAQLRHPNIVQIYEIGTQQGLPFLALEYIDGGCLHEQMAGTPQPPREAAAIVATLARAMHAAHLKGILHRDLKPANILLERKPETPEGQARPHTTIYARFAPRITDFGLAKRLESGAAQTHSDEILGTPSYMAPEQASGHKNEVGPAADVYSLGAILYEMLTGFPPFRGAHPMETVMLVLTTEPAPPRRFRPAVPRDLETICLKCLHKDAHRRYLTAEALAEDLHRFLYGETIHARPVSRGEKAWRWCRRNPAVAVLLALVALLILSGLYAWSWSADQARHREAENARQVEIALEEALRLRGDAKAAGDMARFGEALGAARRAKTLLQQGAASAPLAARVEHLLQELAQEEKNLRTQAQQQARDRRLLRQLEEARLRKATVVRGGMDANQAAPAYRQAFRDYGVNVSAMPLAQAITWFQASAIRLEIAAALDDWAELNLEPLDLRRKLRQLAEALDPDPWRNRLRVALTRDNLTELLALAESAEMAQIAPASLVLLGNRLRAVGKLAEAVAFYRRAQGEHPGDFWINLYLGMWLAHQQQFAEASRFYGIAAAVKPEYPPGHFLLGLSLLQQKRYEDAILPFRKCLALKPDYVEALGNLGTTLFSLDRLTEAEVLYRQMLALDAKHAGGWLTLGSIVLAQGEFAEALEYYRTAAHLPLQRTLVLSYDPRAEQERPQYLDMRKAIADCEQMMEQDRRCREYFLTQPSGMSSAEVVGLARFSKERKRQPALAARFYAEAFRRNAALTATGTHRFDAACAAAQAGTGQGKDAPQITTTERHRWRNQALTWLREEFAAVQPRAKEEPLRVQTRLEAWIKSPALAAVRDAGPLQQLPADERQAWAEFWTQVRAALAEVSSR